MARFPRLRAGCVGATGALSVLCTLSAGAEAGWGEVRTDNWVFFQRNVNNTNQWKVDPRIFVPYSFESGWLFVQRADLPMIDTSDTGPGKPSTGYSGGLGDAFIEEIFTTPEVAPELRFVGSLRLVFPTGRQSPFGASQYQLAPDIGFIWRLPDLLRGATIDPHVRYFWGFDPQYDTITTNRTLDIYPAARFTIADRWTLVLYPENPITYNDRKGTWFTPIDLLFEHRVDPRFSYGFGGAYKLGNPTDPSYRYIIDARFTFVF